MGYESKIYFVKEYPFPENGLHHSRIIAFIDVFKMGYSTEVQHFLSCFDTETEFSLWLPSYDEKLDCEVMAEVIEDCYGSRLCYASNKAELLKAALLLESKDDYFHSLRKVIETFAGDNGIKIVHFGY